MYKLRDSLKIKYLKENQVVLDIETTGVSRVHSKVVVIGVLDSRGNFLQFAIENDDEEIEMLEKVYHYLNCKHIITFNGQNFDIPFLKERYKFNGLNAFEESSQFDIYRFLISNRLLTDFEKFSLQDIEKIKDLERNEDFDVENDVLFYKSVSDMDISKIMVHNKYDVINTESILSIVDDINKNKTINLSFNNTNKKACIKTINLDKNLMEILCSLDKTDLDYRFEDGKYFLDWSKNNLKIRFKVVEGYFDDNSIGLAHILDSENIQDTSGYKLPKNIIPVFENRYFLDNIKNIVKYVFDKFLN